MRKVSALGRRAWAAGMAMGVALSMCAGMASSAYAAGVPAADQHASFLEPNAALPDALNGLMARVPGVRADTWQGRVIAIYGMPMVSADSADAAYQAWLSTNGEAFGSGKLDVRVMWANELDFGKFTVYAGKQYIDDVPVEFGFTRVLVLNTATDHKVVYAAGRLATTPAGGFKADVVRGDEAVNGVRKMEAFQDLTQFGTPEMVVYYGEGDFRENITPVRAWKFVGEIPDASAMRRFTFFIDASTGELVHARNEVLNFVDVTGTVTGWTTPAPLGNSAAAAALPSTQRGLPQIRVRINGNNANSALTDSNGNFTIPWSGTTAVTVDANVGDGQWCRVADSAGLALQSASATATPGTPVSLVLNATAADEFTTAQMNAFTYQTVTHNHWKTYAPTSTILDLRVIDAGAPGRLPANTQVTGTCNAFYNGTSTNFYNTGGGCNNTAFSNVISHEYGHHVVQQLGLAQGAFGEGFGDTMAMMAYDDPVVGRFFTTGGGAVRTPDTTNRQYPCTGSTEVHYCGEILGNVMWEIRRAYGTVMSAPLAREFTRQQHVDWAQITAGGQGVNSAHPTTAIEWLTIDDNDGILGNGTPHFALLCGAFGQSSITCPPLDLIQFQYPDGLPTTTNPSTGVSFRVNVVPGAAGSPLAGTGRLFYSTDGGATYTNVAMAQGAANQYTATLPGAACGSQVQYYVSAQAVGGSTFTSPATAPAATNSVFGGSSVRIALNDDFEIDRGWVVGPTTATTGAWERGDPEATAAQPGDDHTVAGVNCYVTGRAAGTGDGSFDIDGGSTILTSPAFDGSGGCAAIVEYWRWFNNNAGAGAFNDAFVVEISSNGGSTWLPFETVGPGSAANPVGVSGGWIFKQANLSTIAGLTRTNNMKLRFTASDTGTASLVEAALDDVRVTVISGPSCVADTDDGTGSGTPDGGVTIDDLLYYLSQFEAGNIRADVDNGSGTGIPDGGVTIDDLLYYLARFEAGC